MVYLPPTYEALEARLYDAEQEIESLKADRTEANRRMLDAEQQLTRAKDEAAAAQAALLKMRTAVEAYNSDAEASIFPLMNTWRETEQRKE